MFSQFFSVVFWTTSRIMFRSVVYHINVVVSCMWLYFTVAVVDGLD